MDFGNENAIGNYFKKENIYLCTVTDYNDPSLLDELKQKYVFIPKKTLEFFLNNGIISSEQYDIFYKTEEGYTRFLEEGYETFKGDNSDGKGFVENIIPVWDYFKEDELFEIMINGKIMIGSTTIEPLEKYNEDYNLNGPQRKLVSDK